MSLPPTKNTHNYRLLFYASWLVLGLVQARFTELQDDEAYYWVYAHFLDWGYFDHPPMIALLIKAGGFFFKNELGVRLFPVLLNTATLLITEKLIPQRHKNLFYVICLSVAVLQATGFMAVPDVPLLFFTAVFFWCYQRFIKNTTLLNTVLLSVGAALLLYTKYHGVLIIFFTLISNFSLFKKWQTYVAGALCFLLFVPHLWWQYQHNWISFRYHLFESNVNPYKLSYTLDYVAGQLLIAGPIAGFILWPATFLYKPKTALERALKFTGVGILIFFFLSSFKGKVEANWTAPAIIPILVLSHQYLAEHLGGRKWLYRLLPVTVIITLIARVAMIVDVLPINAIVKRYHAWDGWPQQLKNELQPGVPIVFNNSYQRASKTWFYTGHETYSLNNYRDRRNNYNFWPIEDSLLGKPVYNMDIYNAGTFQDSIQARLWKVGFSYDSLFTSFAKVQFVPRQTTYTIHAHQFLKMITAVVIPPYYQSFLQTHTKVAPRILIGIFQGQNWVKDVGLTLSLQQYLQQPTAEIIFRPQLPPGKYYFRFAVENNAGFYTHNSDKINLIVE